MDGMRSDQNVMASLERLMSGLDEPLNEFLNTLHDGGHLDGSPMSLLLYTLGVGVKAWNSSEGADEPFDRMVQAVSKSPALSQLMMMSGRGVSE